MSAATKLTIYFGERARADGGFLSDALVDAFARHRVATSLVLRGVEGFGAKHALRTDRLLSLSEDLPMVAVAVDAPERIAGVAEEVAALPRFSGLVTRERARLLPDAAGPDDAAKLTVYVGRRERAGGRPAYRAVVDLLASLGVAGATVLLGVDGTRWGARERARFLGRNAQVPMMVIAVGDGDRIAGAADAVTALLAEPLVTLERVTIGALAEGAADGSWLKLMAYSSDRDRHRALVAELRRAGAPGATTVRGTWGYHAAAAPHGDHLAQWHRRVPLVTTVLDRPGPAAARSFAVVRRVMGDDALVTCEIVPVGAAPA